MQIGSSITTGLSALAFKVLNSSDRLNSLVNRITGGSINRDTLAQKVLHSALHMGLEYTLAMHGLGDRSATLAPLASKIIFDNTSDEVYTSIKRLTHELVSPDTLGGTGFFGTSGAKLAIAGLGEVAGRAMTETQFTEKLLATMVHEHSLQPLQNYMDHALSGLPIGKSFVKNLVTDILQRAIIDKQELNQSDRPIFRLLAAEANQFLTGENNYTQPLAKYFTEAADTALPDAIQAAAKGTADMLAGTVQVLVDGSAVLAEGLSEAGKSFAQGAYATAGLQTATAVLNTAVTATTSTAVHVAPAMLETTTALTGIAARAAVGTVIYLTPVVKEGAQSLYQGAWSAADQLYHATMGAPVSKATLEAYGQDIKQAQDNPHASAAALPTLDARTRDSQWADALVKQQAITQFALPDTPLDTPQRCVPLEQAFQQGQIDAERKEALTDLTDKLSTDQLAPFGIFDASLTVAKSLSGNLAKVQAESKASLSIANTSGLTTASTINAAPLQENNKGGYKVAGGYAQHVGRLDLDFPEDIYSNADTALDAAKAATNYTMGRWGYTDVNASDWAELRKLYNTCDGNEQLTLKVSSYLDPAMASQALAAPVLDQLDPQNSGRLQLESGLQLQPADIQPHYQYQLRRNHENVELTITASWNIAQYGMDAASMRTPQGTPSSQLTCATTITVPPDGPATRTAVSLDCAIRNEFNFSAYGALELSAVTATSIAAPG